VNISALANLSHQLSLDSLVLSCDLCIIDVYLFTQPPCDVVVYSNNEFIPWLTIHVKLGSAILSSKPRTMTVSCR